MKQLLKIGSFLLLLFLLTAEDCSEQTAELSYEERKTAMFQDIENDFAENELMPEVLSAFEKRSIQKLKDISDFINIYADSAFSEPFREQGRIMIEQNFQNHRNVQTFYTNFGFNEDSVKSILYSNQKQGIVKVKIGSVVISEHLKLESDSKYFGKIHFVIELFTSTNVNNKIIIGKYPAQIEILATKVDKYFGDKRENVWEIFLGETERTVGI